MSLVGKQLQAKQFEVEFMREEEVDHTPRKADLIFSMCQGIQANQHLLNWEKTGTLVVNSPRAVLSCHRVEMHKIADQAGKLWPEGFLIPTHPGSRKIIERLKVFSYWIKRGDVHATERGDVVHAFSLEEIQNVLDSFYRRGIKHAMIQRHVDGLVVKFYGVKNTSFFRWFEESHPERSPEIFGLARSKVEELIDMFDLEIYGGDAVITPSGQIVVIDVNDAPSFALFREEAALAIVSILIDKLDQGAREINFENEKKKILKLSDFKGKIPNKNKIL